MTLQFNISGLALTLAEGGTYSFTLTPKAEFDGGDGYSLGDCAKRQSANYKLMTFLLLRERKALFLVRLPAKPSP